jgi:hypothetical protein
MVSRLVCTTCVIACFAATALPAVAGEPALSPAEKARQHFDRGVARIAEAKWNEAIVELEAARAIYPTAPLHFNLGLAYRAVGRAHDAIASFERYRRAVGDTIDPQRQAELSRYLATLRASLAQLQLDIAPPDAIVLVDGAAVSRAAGLVEVDPGTHKIAVSAEGYTAVTREISVAPGSTTAIELHLAAMKHPAHLRVVSEVASAAIRVDGVGQGSGSLELDVAPGRHVVDVNAPGYESAHREVLLAESGHEELNVALRRQRHVGRWVAVGVVVAAVVAGGAVAMGVVLGTKDQAPIVPPLGTVHTGLRVATW